MSLCFDLVLHSSIEIFLYNQNVFPADLLHDDDLKIVFLIQLVVTKKNLVKEKYKCQLPVGNFDHDLIIHVKSGGS